MCHCNQCEYEWKARPTTSGSPKACPNCKRYDWNEPKKGNRGRNPGDAVAGAEEKPRARKLHKGESGPRVSQVQGRADGTQGVAVGDGKTGRPKSRGTVAQLGERRVMDSQGHFERRPEVAGSSPARSTNSCPECHYLNGCHAKGCSKR